jgi:hypothetical protein
MGKILAQGMTRESEKIERLARQMMKLQQGERAASDNVLAHYLAQESLAWRAIQEIEKEDTEARSNSSAQTVG